MSLGFKRLIIFYVTFSPKYRNILCAFVHNTYRGADKSLAQPTSRRILFDGENIYFDVSLVMYINRTNIPPSYDYK